MKTLLLIISAIALVTACSPKNDNNIVTPAPTKEVATNVTDYSVCDTGPVPASPAGSWEYQAKSPSLSFTMLLTLSRNQVELSTTCGVRGSVLRAHLYARASYDDTKIKFEENKEDIATGNAIDGTPISCKGSIIAKSVSYSFRGPCLILKSDSDAPDTIFIPAN